jgi:hypothetical protein
MKLSLRKTKTLVSNKKQSLQFLLHFPPAQVASSSFDGGVDYRRSQGGSCVCRDKAFLCHV